MRRSLHLVAAAGVALWPLGCLGQESVQELIKQAYASTRDAQSVQDYTVVIDLCQQAQRQQPNAASAEYLRQLLAWALNRRGEVYVDQAAAALEEGASDKARELDGRALADFEAAIQHDATRWKAVHNRGVSYALAGKHQEALADFSRVVQLKSDYANAWFNRAEIHYELGEFAAALADYSHALQLEPDDPATHTSRGHAYLRLEKFPEAIADYTRALELDERNAEAYLNRGEAYQSLKQWAEAAADFRRTIALDPASAWGYQGAAWLMATCPDERFRNRELGVQAAEKAAQLAEHYKILDTLAANYANADRFEDAIKTESAALRLATPQAAEALQQRLELYQAHRPYRQTDRAVATAESQTEDR